MPFSYWAILSDDRAIVRTISAYGGCQRIIKAPQNRQRSQLVASGAQKDTHGGDAGCSGPFGVGL